MSEVSLCTKKRMRPSFLLLAPTPVHRKKENVLSAVNRFVHPLRYALGVCVCEHTDSRLLRYLELAGRSTLYTVSMRVLKVCGMIYAEAAFCPGSIIQT